MLITVRPVDVVLSMTRLQWSRHQLPGRSVLLGALLSRSDLNGKDAQPLNSFTKHIMYLAHDCALI
jgi:hypothetical protein